MSTIERLRALAAAAEKERVEEEAFLRERPKIDWMIYTDRRAVSEAAVNALPALLDVAEAAQEWADADQELARWGEAPDADRNVAAEAACEDRLNLAEIAVLRALFRLGDAS